MGIKPTFSQQDILQAFKLKAQRMDSAIVSRFIFVGETFVVNARAKGNYTDQTGNLRSAISYIVFKDGIKRSPGAISDLSKDLIAELRSKYMKGYVLIVCTGMDYAAADWKFKDCEERIRCCIENIEKTGMSYTSIEVINVLYQTIANSAVLSDVKKPNGKICKMERPLNSVLEDIVINGISLDRDELQEGVLNVNVYIPNLFDSAT
jgi:hypothetical protein